MTVKDLKEILEKYDDELLVVFHKDSETIGFHKVLDEEYNIDNQTIDDTYYCLVTEDD